jgi:hypothetical protein
VAFDQVDRTRRLELLAATEDLLTAIEAGPDDLAPG